MAAPTTTAFIVYRWANPQTTSDYPYLAVAQDRSALLSLGDYGATLDWGIPDEATDWLARDFAERERSNRGPREPDNRGAGALPVSASRRC